MKLQLEGATFIKVAILYKFIKNIKKHSGWNGSHILKFTNLMKVVATFKVTNLLENIWKHFRMEWIPYSQITLFQSENSQLELNIHFFDIIYEEIVNKIYSKR